MSVALGLVLAFGIGASCHYFAIPVPAPPRIVGALLVVAMTVGFVITDWLLVRLSLGP